METNSQTDFNLKQELMIPNPDLPVKRSSLKTKMKIHNFKEIMSITSQVFLQLFLALLITQINSFMFGWYDNRTYLSVVNKITIFYTTFQFVPSLVASGVLIVGNNFIGQGKNKELSSLIVSGLVVNLFFTALVVIITNLLSTQFFNFLDIHAGTPVQYISGTETVAPTNFQWEEMTFAKRYYAVYSCQLIFLGIAQVYISALQSVKKQMHVNIGAISSNIIDVVLVAVFLYAAKVDPIWCSFSIFISTFLQMIYMGFMAHRFVHFETKNSFKLINWHYMIEITKVGIPITLEMGLWNVCNFTCQSGITQGTGGSFDLSEAAVNIHRGVWSLSQYSSTFLQAMGTVTSMFVAKKVGEGDLEGAYEEGMNCWRLSIYAQLTLSTIMFAGVYPYLLALNIDQSQILIVGFPLYALIFIKMLFDTVNLTLLRALWAVGNLWFPLLVSIFTMGIFLALIPILVGIYVSPIFHNAGDQHDGAHTMMIIYGSICFDPISRSIIYTATWMRKKWKKYAKKL
jgi:Na+-driven multidrug efflux pump